MVTFKGVTNIGLQNFESCMSVASLVNKRNPDSANSIDDLFERAKVDVDVMVNCDTEVFFDRAYQAVWVLLIEVGVDASVASGAGLSYPHVSRKRKNSCLVIDGVNANHHD